MSSFGGAGDITTYWKMDTSDVDRGASRAAREFDRAATEAEKQQARSERAFKKGYKDIAGGFLGILGAREVFRYAGEAVDEYAKRNESAALSVGKLAKAQQEFKRSLGSDLAQGGGFGGLRDLGAWALNGLGGARNWIVDRMATNLRPIMGGDGAVVGGLNGAIRDDDESAQRSVGLRESVKMWSAVRQLRAEIAGDPYSARVLGEEQRHREAVRGIEQAYKDLPGAIAPAREAEDAWHTESLKRLDQIERARRKAFEDETRFIEEATEVRGFADEMRREGKDEAAARAEIELDFAQKRAALEGRTDITDEEKASRREALNRAEANAIGNAERGIRAGREERARDARARQNELDQEHRARMDEMSGHRSRAEMMREQIRFEKERQEILDDNALSAGEKADHVARAEGRHNAVLAAMARQQVEEAQEGLRSAKRNLPIRMIGPGMGGEFMRSAIFGPGAGGNFNGPPAPTIVDRAQAELKEAIDRQTAVLEAIQQNTVGVGTFG